MTIDRERLKQLVDKGWTLEAIGHEFDVSRQRIKQLVDKLGWTRADNRINPDKVIKATKPHYPGGITAYKKANGLCTYGGCMVPVSTKTLCAEHAEALRAKARKRKDKYALTS